MSELVDKLSVNAQFQSLRIHSRDTALSELLGLLVGPKVKDAYLQAVRKADERAAELFMAGAE